MNEKNINIIIKDYKSFKESLIKDIKNKLNPKIVNNKECYLINNNWYEELSNIIYQYEKYKNIYEIDKKLKNLFSKKKPEFINNIESVVNNILYNSFNLKLVSYNLIKVIYNHSINLNNYNRVHYYAGNNKIIIEFIEENECILLINPLEDISLQEIIIFKINSWNAEKINLYRELLSKDKIEIKYLQVKNNINIIKYKKYNKLNDSSSHYLKTYDKEIKNNEQSNQNKKLLNTLINY